MPYTEQDFKNKIYAIRGVQVMLDSDLADFYMVGTKYLNKAVKRNIDRFPADFMFQLSNTELKDLNLRFQIGTSSLKRGQGVETKLTEGKKYVYAMVNRDEVFFMFMSKEAYAEDVPALKGVPISASATLYCDVDDVKSLYASYKELGVEIVKDLAVTWYGMEEFYIKDCNGYILGFASKA